MPPGHTHPADPTHPAQPQPPHPPEHHHPLHTWQSLLEPDSAKLIEAAANTDPADPRAVEALRRHHPPHLIAAALDLAAARRKAQRKIPAHAHRLVADPPGVEMASSTPAAAWKARRFAGASGPVLDLCCGIGGDAIELAALGLDLTPIDLDPLRAWMASVNAARPARAADAAQALHDAPGALVHIDPARRDHARRRIALDRMTPGPDVVRALIAAARGAAVKLAPGVEPHHLAQGQAEFIAEQGRLTQAVLWTGALDQDAPHRATTLPTAHSIAGHPRPVDLTHHASAYLYTADPALERARLIHAVAEPLGLLGLADPGTGLLTGDQPLHSPWLRGYPTIARLPWQPRRVRAELRRLGAGLVRVKTRGGAVDPDKVQSMLRGPGDTELVVFILRLGQRTEALIAGLDPAQQGLSQPSPIEASPAVHPDER